VEGVVKERARVDGDPGGAPADGVGAPGGVKDVNLQQGKLSERRLKHQRGRKGEDEPFTGNGSFTGGKWRTEVAASGKLGLKHACWCVAEAKGRTGA
jgi:hypothetical protein